MIKSRIKIFPEIEKKVEELKSIMSDGRVIKAELEFVEQDIELDKLKYHIFVGSTAGKKGLPNQDFAGFARRDLSIEGREWSCLLAVVADGVSSREKSEETSRSIVENTIESFSKFDKSYHTFELLSETLWHWMAQGAQGVLAPLGVSTVSAFLLAVLGEETVGLGINCGDSRVYWATSKYVESAKVHTDVASSTGSITYSLGADRKMRKFTKTYT